MDHHNCCQKNHDLFRFSGTQRDVRIRKKIYCIIKSLGIIVKNIIKKIRLIRNCRGMKNE